MDPKKQQKPESISVGNMTGAAFTIGDSNKVNIQFQKASVPEPETVDIKAELQALRDLLTELNRQQKNVFVDASTKMIEQELVKDEPDKDVVSDTLETGIKYANKLEGFGEAIDKLRPRVEAVAGWLGEHGYKLLPLVGLV